MKILCEIFGHKPPVYAKSGWYSPGEKYANAIYQDTDNIGRHHARVESECPRCGEWFVLCFIHLPQAKP